jgi:hypothetical protein
LKRIKNPAEIAEYTQAENIKEIVKVECFTLEELLMNKGSEGESIIIAGYCPGCKSHLVDNVLIDEKTFGALNSSFFKEVEQISEHEEAFAQYLELLAGERNRGGYRSIYIITL